MKKKILGISIGGLLCVGLLLFAVRVLPLGAEENGDVFLMDGTKLMQYTGDSAKVTVPANVTLIAQGAFEDNDTVKEVILPGQLESIEYNAFAECDNLEKISIPDNVISIGSSAFANCSSLKEVSIGKGLSKLGSGVFAGCTSLKNITVSEKSTTFTCLDGVLFNADRTELYQMLPGREKNFYVMNDRVTTIGQYAFWGCDNLEHIILSNNLSEISPYAFSNASGLKSVAMSFNVKSIGMKAFEDCASLEQIYIPDSVVTIDDTAFDGCKSLQIFASTGSSGAKFAEANEIALLNSPKYALNYADSLSEEWTQQRDDVSEDIVTSESAEIANEGIAEIPDGDLLGSTSIVANNAMILMDNTIPEVVSGGNVKWNELLMDQIQDGKIPENLFYLKTDLKSIAIPDTVTEIGKFSFARSGLSKIEIPEGVTHIGYGAFYHCDELEEVSIPITVTTIDEKAFEKTLWMEKWLEESEDDYLVVGDGVLLAYKGNAEDFEMPADVKYVACEGIE